jgi:CxC2 like cysteine cluster associated with KDZ transposases
MDYHCSVIKVWLIADHYQSQNDFMREWLTKRQSFLHLLLQQESPPIGGICDSCGVNNGTFRCSDCFGNLAVCRNCLMDHHKLLPFHRIRKWNGKYFAPTTLFNQGYILHLGHRGMVCPSNPVNDDVWEDIDEGSIGFGGVGLLDDEIHAHTGETLGEGVVDIVHTVGVFRHNVRWCGCQGSPEKGVQLFQMQLFPASHQRPQTAFTFDALDYFYIDSMECKTSAASFYKKICRLTNNAFPHIVTVSVKMVHS